MRDNMERYHTNASNAAESQENNSEKFDFEAFGAFVWYLSILSRIHARNSMCPVHAPFRDNKCE